MLRTALLCGAAALVAPTEVFAQTSAPPVIQQADQTDGSAETAAPEGNIIVTGSRIVSNGFNQPTPVTVISEAEINRQAPPTIASYLNQLPSFGVSTSARNPAINVAGGGAEFVNLRNLGALRTLVLLDNRRVVEATTAGGVDTVTLPLGLIKRVDVVTGGASAAYGSDAVAGVVNFILNREYEGLGVNFETGISGRGDGGYMKANLTAGQSFADGRGHIVAELDLYRQRDGVDLSSRDWFTSRAVVNNPAYVAGNGQVRQITVANVGTGLTSPGGVIVSANRANGTTVTATSLRGIQFVGPNGMRTPYNFGSASTTVQYGGDVDNTVGLARSIVTPLEYANGFAHVDYALTPNITAYVEGFYGKSSYTENGYLYYYRQGNLRIQADNAFLADKPDIRSQLAAGGFTSFNLGKTTVNMGPPTSRNKREVWRAVAGLDGTIGDSWKWNAYYTHGEVTTDLYADNNTIVARFANAVDSVLDASGNPVCRSTLSNPGNGCVPYNPFGTGEASAATIAYTHGTAYQRSVVKLDVASLEASGSLFTLPAGDVAVAIGADYIRNQAYSTQDALALAGAFAVQNFQPFSGERNVKEAFGEIAIPLLKGVPGFQKLDVNGAVRVTNYSTSGTVTTWKVGVTDEVFDDLRLRATLSRDIRAPTLTDLFSGGVLTQQSVFDTVTQKPYAQYTNQQGNPDLKPEVAKTLTAGVVYSPSFVPGLQFSIDYYRINLQGAIASITAAKTLEFCNTGQTDFCQYITRDATQAITSIKLLPFNSASLKVQGWDFELGYRRSVGNGAISLRALASYVPILTQTDPLGNVTKFAGQVADLNPGQPKWKGNVAITLDQGPASLTLTSRYVGAAKLQNAWAEGVDVDENDVPSFVTFGLTAQYRIAPLTFTLGVDNLFDRDNLNLPAVPGSVGYAAPGLGGRFDLYDPMGRTFRFGVRAKF